MSFGEKGGLILPGKQSLLFEGECRPARLIVCSLPDDAVSRLEVSSLTGNGYTRTFSGSFSTVAAGDMVRLYTVSATGGNTSVVSTEVYANRQNCWQVIEPGPLPRYSRARALENSVVSYGAGNVSLAVGEEFEAQFLSLVNGLLLANLEF
jgi:hypothetical protein